VTRPLWRDPDFARLYGAGTISIFGSLITRTALPFAAILVLGSGPMGTSLLNSAGFVAVLLVGFVAGAWVDRLYRRPVMVAADLGRAILLGSIPVAAVLGVLSFAQLIVVAFLAAILSTFFGTAERAYLPTLVGRDRLVRANSIIGATDSAAEFLAFGIGGVLVTLLTAPIAIAVDAVSFVVSGGLIASIRHREPPPPPPAAREPILLEIREGLRIVLASPTLRAIAISHGLGHVMWGVFGALYLIYASETLGLSPAAIGIIAGLGGLASLAGASLAPRLVARFGAGRTMLGGLALLTLGSAALPLAPSGAPLVAAAFLVAAQAGDGGATAAEVVESSLIAASAPGRTLGRINASIEFFTILLALVGSFLGGIVGELVGLREAFWIGIVGGLGAMAAVWSSPVRHLRDLPIGEDEVAAVEVASAESALPD
jgi:MFS family permease